MPTTSCVSQEISCGVWFYLWFFFSSQFVFRGYFLRKEDAGYVYVEWFRIGCLWFHHYAMEWRWGSHYVMEFILCIGPLVKDTLQCFSWLYIPGQTLLGVCYVMQLRYGCLVHGNGVHFGETKNHIIWNGCWLVGCTFHLHLLKLTLFKYIPYNICTTVSLLYKHEFSSIPYEDYI